MLTSRQVMVAPALSKKMRQNLNGFVTHIFLLLFGFAFALPFFWMLSTSFKPDAQIFVLPPQWIPQPIMWANYPRALTYIPYFLYFKNTMYIALFNVVATLISCTFVAYGFARINWPGRGMLFSILLATLMIPSQVTLIPTFLIFRQFGWVGTPNPLTWPSLFGNAFFIFLLRQFYLTIPQELSQAAKIDGASEFAIYWRIILPLARPAMATVALFTFLANWNDFLGPLIYLSDKQQYTLALGLYGFAGSRGTEWGLLMAAGTVTIMPIVILFFLAQRTFIEGITLTGTKG